MPTPENNTWIEVAQTTGSIEAEIIGGLLRSAEIPVYIESIMGMPSLFGHLGDARRVYVPESYYEMAIALLDDHEDDLPPAIDEPGIKL